MNFGILGSGSWGTAIAKILTDNLSARQEDGNKIHWWNRSAAAIEKFKISHHNPQYLQSARFDISKLELSCNVDAVIKSADVIIIVIPSAFVCEVLSKLEKNVFRGKKIISAVKGILPEQNVLLNEYLKTHFDFPVEDYYTLLGPCHAEEVASEKLSYLTFTGLDEQYLARIAARFKNAYINTILNRDIYGVQYAAVLKNIYAVGSGIAHGLDYGDNFLSVLIANSADEMAGFLRKAGILDAEVGYLEHKTPAYQEKHHNYATSVYLGDLLVTCYSLHSRNRTFGNMIGKGYSVQAAQLEMSMIAEGYNASKCMQIINKNIGAEMPIAETIYRILWQQLPAREGFNYIESVLV